VIRRSCALCALLLVVRAWAAGPTGASVARAVREVALDPQSCYRVRELNFSKEDLKFYLTDGFLIFAKPIEGQRLFAVFSADVEAGDAEVLVMPPHRSERKSLATFSGAPNLDEHFKTAVFVFSEGTGDELYTRAVEMGKPSAEMGALMADRWGPTARNIAESFEIRMVQDVLSPTRAGGVLLAAIAGTQLGNFDAVYDPWGRDQVLLGQYTSRSGLPYFDIWTSFEARSIRTGRQQRPKPLYALSDYRIDASLDPSLHMTATVRAKLRVTVATRAFSVQVSEKVRIVSATVDGQPVEAYARESMRESALRGGGVATYVIVSPELMQPGVDHEVVFQQDGDVVLPAGNDVYFVTSRGTWYPRVGLEFANYDLIFRYPKHLTLVATGEAAEDKTEGDIRVSRWKTIAPVRLAGFNLGQYQHVKIKRADCTFEVFGNRSLEPSLQPKAPVLLVPSIQRSGSRHPQVIAPPPDPVPNPASRLATLAENVASAFDYMRSQFGPPPIKTLTVAPIPGAFGQGFPGLVYLSTLAYLRPEERPASVRNRDDELFFNELLAAHEVAHQWWGNMVVSQGYQDDWLLEALANYAAIGYLEKRKGARAVDSLMETFQEHLLRKAEDGSTIESKGPVTWGLRLQSSHGGGVWRAITYEKGSWILHMLRRRMGDDNFRKLLSELCRRYAHQGVTTEQFRALAEESMGAAPGSLADFFESWVYGTGIPTLKVDWSVKGKAPALRVVGTVAQTGVDGDFTVDVPVEIHFAKGPSKLIWVKTSDEPVPFMVNVRQHPSRVAVPAGTGILAIRK
jgi:hypothetical protein